MRLLEEMKKLETTTWCFTGSDLYNTRFLDDKRKDFWKIIVDKADSHLLILLNLIHLDSKKMMAEHNFNDPVFEMMLRAMDWSSKNIKIENSSKPVSLTEWLLNYKNDDVSFNKTCKFILAQENATRKELLTGFWKSVRARFVNTDIDNILSKTENQRLHAAHTKNENLNSRFKNRNIL